VQTSAGTGVANYWLPAESQSGQCRRKWPFRLGDNKNITGIDVRASPASVMKMSEVD
jgi:hypothetical protein